MEFDPICNEVSSLILVQLNSGLSQSQWTMLSQRVDHTDLIAITISVVHHVSNTKFTFSFSKSNHVSNSKFTFSENQLQTSKDMKRRNLQVPSLLLMWEKCVLSTSNISRQRSMAIFMTDPLRPWKQNLKMLKNCLHNISYQYNRLQATIHKEHENRWF